MHWPHILKLDGCIQPVQKPGEFGGVLGLDALRISGQEELLQSFMGETLYHNLYYCNYIGYKVKPGITL